jgi:putative aldouronate transport system permease protein
VRRAAAWTGRARPSGEGNGEGMTTTAGHFLRKARKSVPYYLLLLLPLAHLLIFRYVPMYGVQIAFKNYQVSKGMWGSPWVGMKYFALFLASPSFWTILSNTVTISLYGLLAGFPLAIVLAIALNETRNRTFKKTVQMVTYMPYFISTVVLVSMIMQFTDLQTGLVNQFLRLVGGRPRNFMGVPEYFKSIYVWTGVWQNNGYSAIIFLAALSSVNPELHEAAIVDGASKLRRIWHIDLPGISSAIAILLILNAGYVLSVGFEKVFLMQNGLNMQVSEVISTYVYKIGLQNMDFSYSTAVGLFNSVVNLLLLAVFNGISRRLGQASLW